MREPSVNVLLGRCVCVPVIKGAKCDCTATTRCVCSPAIKGTKCDCTATRCVCAPATKGTKVLLHPPFTNNRTNEVSEILSHTHLFDLVRWVGKEFEDLPTETS